MSAASVKHLGPTQVEMEISISPEELEAARERAFRALVKRTKIPGFRPGKAPRKIFESQYGAETIAERAMEEIVPRVYSQAVRENDLDPLEQPQLELLPREDDDPVRVRATVAVRPRIELKDYKGIPIVSVHRAATEEEFDHTLAELRRRHATLVLADRPVRLGDVPTLDYEGKIDGVPFAGGKAENHPTELDADRFIAGFAEGIVGMKAGESKEVEASFPEDYGNKELAGKKAVFTILVHENKVPELPELDDDFAKRFNPEGTLETFKADMRKRLDDEAGRRARESMKNAVLEKLVERHEVPLPQGMVEREAEAILEDLKRRVSQAEVSWDAYLAEVQKTEEALREEHLAEARRRVKLTLLIEAIAKAEDIEATAEELDEELTVLAQRYGRRKHEIVEMLRPTMGAFIGGIVRSKTVDFLLDQAVLAESVS
jgi:trigger factor